MNEGELLQFWQIFFAKLPVFLPYLLKGALVTVEITGASLALRSCSDWCWRC